MEVWEELVLLLSPEEFGAVVPAVRRGSRR